MKRYFLITIDTEGDNLWAPSSDIRVENIGYLPRFQSLCEDYGFKVTYLTDYRVALDPAFVKFGREALKRGAEIGMHLHAWDTPPAFPLTRDDCRFHPYLTEYPVEVIEQKVDTVTRLLEERFERRIVSHRAGRWSLNEQYAAILAGRGYKVDCSVTPFMSWRHNAGNPDGNGGPDYSDFACGAYFMDLKDIRQPGSSSLLEVPVTVAASMPRLARAVLKAAAPSRRMRAAAHRAFRVCWLRPNGSNREDMLHVLDWSIQRNCHYVEFMLHSSELMPGGSPFFPRPEDIENLYQDLDALFAAAKKSFTGATLQEYYDYYSSEMNRTA